MMGRFSLTFAAVAVAAPALAVEVTRTVEVDAPASEVWDAIGPFCAIGEWYPGLDSCTEETIDGARHRKLVASDGAEFLERYMETGSDMSYGYAIIESPLPVKDYESTLAVEDMGDTATITWSSTFAAEGATDEEAEDLLGGIYQTGLDALKAKFSE